MAKSWWQWGLVLGFILLVTACRSVNSADEYVTPPDTPISKRVTIVGGMNDYRTDYVRTTPLLFTDLRGKPIGQVKIVVYPVPQEVYVHCSAYLSYKNQYEWTTKEHRKVYPLVYPFKEGYFY